VIDSAAVFGGAANWGGALSNHLPAIRDPLELLGTARSRHAPNYLGEILSYPESPGAGIPAVRFFKLLFCFYF
jgi:hypothetical protein